MAGGESVLKEKPAGMVSTGDMLTWWRCSYMSLYRWRKQGKITPAGRRGSYFYRVADVDRLAQEKGYLPVNRWGEK